MPEEAPSGAEPAINEPLFILAPPRSFTSVVCAMIGNHPQMVGLPETNLFTADTIRDLQRVHRSRPRLAHGLLRSLAQLALGGQSVADIHAAQQWIDELGDVDTADVFRDLMDWAHPRAVIDKSPMYVYAGGALERILAAFPKARFLHLSRHPRGTCESIYETRSAVQNARGGVLAADSTMTPDALWLKPHQRIAEVLSVLPPEQRMFLRGEALMANPQAHLPAIATWLGIRADDDALAAMLRPEQSPFACVGPENARHGNDPHFLQSPKLRPYREKPSDLDNPLSWDAELVFDETLKQYARSLGY